MMNNFRRNVGIAPPQQHVVAGPAPTIAPNTGMAPHPILQAGPAQSRPVMGIDKGELGSPWARMFAR